jgi:hypothetical protein
MWPYLKPAYTQATRMVAPVAVRASRLGGGSLPTGFVESMEEAATTTGGRCLTVRPPEMITRTVPRGHPDHSDDYVPWLSEHVRRVAVAELPHGRVLSPHSAVITANDDLVVEVSLYFGTSRAREHPIFLHPFSGLPLEVGGRLGVLALQGDANYYHFFMDVLPRLGVLERCPAIAPPDLWYVPTAAPFQRELLEMMGLDLTRVVDSSQRRHVVAETLVVPSPPAMTLINPPWSVEYLRSKLLPGPITRVEGKGIYVQRGGGINNRCVLNEADLVDYLDGRGFTILPESLPARAKIEAFAQTSIVVGAHSAGLVNVVFASPGAALVELFPAGGINTCYWKLAQAVPGVEYRYVLGRGDPRPVSASTLLVSDIEADIPAIGRTLDDLGWPS